jgi:hypothetical protein
MNDEQTPDFSLSPLQTFFAKVAIVTGAFLITLYYASSLTVSFVSSQSEKLSILKGGPAFWGTLEQKFYDFADAPDLPPEKKQKIVAAIHKLSVKYKPYVDAFSDAGQPGAPDSHRPN